MRQLYRGYVTTAIFAIAVSFCMSLYAAAEIWINVHEGRPGLCGAWLCPDEFTSSPIFAWHPDVDPQHLPQQIDKYKRGLEFDPDSAYRWADLGERMLAAHREEDARYCFQQAVQQGPRSPAVLYRAANFYFSTGDYQRAMHDLYPILQDPDLYMYQKPAYMIYQQMGLPIGELLERGVPATPYAARGLLTFLMGERQVADAEEAWQWMASRSLADSKIAGEYIDFLIQNNEASTAANEWAERNQKNEPQYRLTNWVYNGSFESTPMPTLLDWHLEGTKDVTVNRTQTVAREGRWSLEFTFDGQENVDYHKAFEQTAVKQGKWRLSTLEKTQSVTTDQGISLHVFDVEDGKRLDMRTDPVVGTHDWFPIVKEFDIGPGTKVVQLEIMRAASQQFDNKIDGRAWVDAVELSPVASPIR